MFFNNGNLKTIVFPLIFLDFYEKSKKKPLGNTMVLYYQIRKIQIFPLCFLDFIKIPKKNNENPKIPKSKTFKDFPKSFGFLDFCIFSFLDFYENCVPVFCLINALLNFLHNTEITNFWIPPVFGSFSRS